MKLLSSLLAMAALLAGVSAHAGPPPGHPSPAAAADMLQLPKSAQGAELPNKGTVVSTIDANEYTYIEVSNGKQTAWLAAPKMKLAKGNVIRFEDGARMTNFYSKLLKRTFPVVMFVNTVVVSKEKG